MPASFKRKIGKYEAFAAIALRHELRHRVVMLGKIVFFVVLLLIFSNLWRVAGESGMHMVGTPSAMLWYLFVTECVVLSTPRLFEVIEEDIRSGSIASQLTRPYQYPLMLLSRGAGTLAVRLFYLALIGGGATSIFSGEIPFGPAAALSLAVLVPLAALVLMTFEACVGMAAFWLQSAFPVYLVWQKLLFIFGGLMLPLTIYPQWMQDVARFTPFFALLYGSSRMVFEFSWPLALATLLMLLAWGAAALLLLKALFGLACRGLTVNGG